MDASWETSEWYVRWCEPIVAALWERDKKQIKARLFEAQGAITNEHLSDEERLMLNAHLAYLEFQVCTVIRPKGWIDSKLPNIVSQLEDISEQAQLNHMRARLLLQISILLDRMELRTLTRTKYTTLVMRMGKGELPSETWYYVGVWAFKHGYCDILESAFEHFFDQVSAQAFYNRWSYHLIKLMSNIRSNCATKAELLKIIDLAEVPQQLNSLKAVVWEGALESLLVDQQVIIAFETKISRLNLKPSSNRSNWFRKGARNPNPSMKAGN